MNYFFLDLTAFSSQTKSYFNIESHNDKSEMLLKYNLIHFVYPIKFMQEVISMKKNNLDVYYKQ